MFHDRKAQVIVTDFFVSLGIFIIMAVIIAIFAQIYQANLLRNMEYNDMFTKAIAATEALTITPGFPLNWTNKTVEVPGLINAERNLSHHKLNMMMNTSVEVWKDKLNVQSYNLSISLHHANGTEIAKISDIESFSLVATARGYLLFFENVTYIEVLVAK